MAMLRSELGLERPDDFYDLLMQSFDGLTKEQSDLVMAKLILVLANHIGDHQVLKDALVIAREDVAEAALAQRKTDSTSSKERVS